MKYIYTGVFFNPCEMLSKFNCYIGAKRLAKTIENPHITFTFNPKYVNELLFGRDVTFRVIAYANDGKNQGVKVETLDIWRCLEREYAKIAVPHITISVSEDGKPVDTEKLVFQPIEHSFFITGYYGAFTTNGVITKNPYIK